MARTRTRIRPAPKAAVRAKAAPEAEPVSIGEAAQAVAQAAAPEPAQPTPLQALDQSLAATGNPFAGWPEMQPDRPAPYQPDAWPDGYALGPAATLDQHRLGQAPQPIPPGQKLEWSHNLPPAEFQPVVGIPDVQAAQAEHEKFLALMGAFAALPDDPPAAPEPVSLRPLPAPEVPYVPPGQRKPQKGAAFEEWLDDEPEMPQTNSRVTTMVQAWSALHVGAEHTVTWFPPPPGANDLEVLLTTPHGSTRCRADAGNWTEADVERALAEMTKQLGV